ncbi:MAG: hypothetical protein JXB34_00390 [Bacteroidales bacterium]|nr:hypothetical protein [Bacteroidales bacterium]
MNNKAILIISSLMLVWANFAAAQKPVRVNESDILFGHGSLPGFLVTIPEVPLKTIEDSWVKNIEKGTKSKVQKELGEMTIFGSIMKEIAGGPINVYSYVKQSDSAVLLAVSFELKKNEYINSANREYEFGKAKEYLFLFAKSHYLDLAKEQLQTEEKKLKKLENDFESLQNEKNKLDRLIQSNSSTIATTSDELVVLRANLLSLNNELTSQNEQFKSLESGAAKDEKKKYIADLEKRIKKTNSDISSAEKKISSLTAESDMARNSSLPTNLKEQEKLSPQVNQQKEVVNFYSNKFNTIKNYQAD